MNTQLNKSLATLALLATATLLSGCADASVQAAPTQSPTPARSDVKYVDERYAMQDRLLVGPNVQDGEYRTFTFQANEPRAYVTTTMTWYHVDGSPVTLGHSQGQCEAIDPLDPMATRYGTTYVAPNGTKYTENELAGPRETPGFLKHQRSLPWAAGKWTVQVAWCGYNTDIELEIMGSDTKTATHEHGTWV